MVRTKVAGDEEACLELLEQVHASDGYPSRWPDDPGRFLTPPHQRAAWVAVQGDRLVGHVALHADAGDPALEPSCRATGLRAGQITVLSRLLVAPIARRQGVGRALLAQATKAAHELGLLPVLDVAKSHKGAIGLYEACGWTRASDLTITFRSGATLDCWLYIGPAPGSGAPS